MKAVIDYGRIKILISNFTIMKTLFEMEEDRKMINDHIIIVKME